MLLLLFDVDGTLLLTHDQLYVDCALEAVEEVWGMRARPVDGPGETATHATRRMVEAAGGVVGERMPEWCRRFSQLYVERLAAREVCWKAAPGAAGALAELQGGARLALLTGNPEPVAWARMERIGLVGFFERGQGGFGCEAEDRRELYAFALERAGGWPAPQAVAVGDTPRDVESAHAAGARVVGVTTGRFDAAALSGADAVVARLAELPQALATMRAAGD